MVLFPLCMQVQRKISLKPLTGTQPTSLMQHQVNTQLCTQYTNKSPLSPHPTIVFVGLCVIQPVVGFSFHRVRLKSP